MVRTPRRRTSSLVLLRRGRRAPPDPEAAPSALRPVVRVATADSQTVLIRRDGRSASASARPAAADLLRRLVPRQPARERAEGLQPPVSTIATESARQVGAPFFQLLTRAAAAPAAGPPDGRSRATASQAEQQYEQARRPRRPERHARRPAVRADRARVRRDGLDRIAQQIRLALGDESEQADDAIKQIAGQMEAFLASDVVWDTRVIPFITERARAARDRRAGDQPVAVPARHRVARATRRRRRCSTTRSRAAVAGAASRPARACTARGWTRRSTATSAPARRAATGSPYEPGTGFTVNFTNQGENDEFDVKVTLRIQGEGRRPDHHVGDDPAGRRRARRTAELPLERPAAARHGGSPSA